MSVQNGRFLESVRDRIIFANGANRDETISSKLTPTQKMVGKNAVRAVRVNVKLVRERTPVVIPDVSTTASSGTEQLVAELGFSGSEYNKEVAKQMVIDLCHNVIKNIDDYMGGWNLNATTAVTFNNVAVDVE